MMADRQKHELDVQAKEENQSQLQGLSAAKEVGPPEGLPAAEVSQEACLSSALMQATLWSKASEASGGQAKLVQSSSRFLLRPQVQRKVVKLVKYLSFKYTTNSPVTEEEMLDIVVHDFKGFYAVIFRQARDCMEIVFGIHVKRVNAFSRSYVLLKILDLAYDGQSSSEEGFLPKTGLLVLILGVILKEGNRASEKKIWEVLDSLRMCPDQLEFICGDLRKFIYEDLVAEKYVEYQKVPGSDPPLCEFTWGPRAHAETSKKKVLQFFSKVAGKATALYRAKREEAQKDEEEED